MRNGEIGGYFGLECYGAGSYHAGAVELNSGRNALRYLIRAYGIDNIFVPYFTCPAVWDALREEGCSIALYNIDDRFMPTARFPQDAYVLTNDWFGVSGGSVALLAGKYENLIVDNAQSFYAEPGGIGSFYSPSKFFGLPDGGLLVCGKRIEGELPRDASNERAAHLLKRHDLGAGAGYGDFKANEDLLSKQPVMGMSSLTRTLMGNIDYARARRVRLDNFRYLHSELSGINELDIDEDSIVCPMAYPLLLSKKGLREKLIADRIYVARYWDDSGGIVPKGSFSAYLSENLLPLPIDQRYTPEDMVRVINVIMENLREQEN